MVKTTNQILVLLFHEPQRIRIFDVGFTKHLSDPHSQLIRMPLAWLKSLQCHNT